MTVLGWRDVPVVSNILGATSRNTEPKVRQIFVGMGETFYNRQGNAEVDDIEGRFGGG